MRKYYDDDEASHDEGDREQPVFKDLPPEPLRPLDWLLAAGACVLTVVLLSVFAFPGVSPEVWSDASVASGIRPPTDPFPGVWRLLASFFYLGGIDAGNHLLVWVGRSVLGVSAALVYLFLRVSSSLIMRLRLRYAPQRYLMARTAAALGTFCFVCADPVWRSGQVFSPATLQMFSLTIVLFSFFAFLLNGRTSALCACMTIMGVLSADTPLGFVVLAICWLVYYLCLRFGVVSASLPLLNPVSGATVKWTLTFFYVLGFLLGVGVNCTTFITMQGLAAAGVAGIDLPLLYLTHYWQLITSAASWLGWLLGIGTCVIPFVVTTVLLPRAIDEEVFLPYHVGALYLIAGLLTFSQLAMLSPLWFWNWSESAQVNSSLLMLVFMFCAACTVAHAFAVFGGDALCRNKKRIAVQRFADLREDDEPEMRGDKPVSPYSRPSGKLGFVIYVFAGLLLVAAVVPGRRMTRTRAMLDVLETYAREVAAECDGVTWLFTDGAHKGAFDARHEIDAAAKGRKLCAISMMADNSPYQIFLRSRFARDQEDRTVLAIGAPAALRTWQRDRPERMKETGVQLGFELWKKDGREIPPCSGVLSRPLGMDPAACREGVARTAGLVEKIHAIYAMGGPSRAAGRLVKELFLFVQWRVSRLARMRAERLDRAGETAAALADRRISDALDDTNESLQRILRAMEHAKETMLKQISPREGLQLALVRRDFATAERWAKPILDSDPNNADANFGTGMCYYMQKQFGRAEEYLKRVLKTKPNEPATLNNLGMICLATGRYNEGLVYARQALAVIPESPDVKDTIAELEKAKAEAAKKKSKPAADHGAAK